MKKRTLTAWLLLLTLGLSGCGATAPTQTSQPDVQPPAATPTPTPTQTPTPTPTPAPTHTIDPLGELIASMTQEEKVGQLLIAGFQGTVAGEELKTLIREERVGGIILFKRNVESATQLVELTNAAKALNGGYVPLLVTVDQEGGTVNRMPSEVAELPSADLFGAIADPEERWTTCYRLGQTLADQCKAFGFNVDFAPVLDVWSNPENTVIAQRAFGSDVQTVTDAAPMVAYGLMDSGVIPVVKHFPGHGDTAVDSHAGLPVVEKTLAELEELELRPFREAVSKSRKSGSYDPASASVPGVMVSHILLTQVDDKLPASLSPKVVDGLLREELGFQGVVFTDDMTMAAITQNYDIGEAAVLAVEAGCDQLLICRGMENVQAVRAALLEAVEDDRISEERLEESLRRVLSLKRDYALTDDSVPVPDLEALNAKIGALALAG